MEERKSSLPGQGGAEERGRKPRSEEARNGIPSEGAGERGRRGVSNTENAINARNAITPLKVFGNDYPTRDGTCVRDYIHVIDLAQAHILALNNLYRHPNGKYNLGNGQGFTVLEVIETAKRVTGVDIPYEFAPRRSGDPAVLIASSELAKKELGWKPRSPGLESIIRSAWEWQRAHPEGYGSSPAKRDLRFDRQ